MDILDVADQLSQLALVLRQQLFEKVIAHLSHFLLCYRIVCLLFHFSDDVIIDGAHAFLYILDFIRRVNHTARESIVHHHKTILIVVFVMVLLDLFVIAIVKLILMMIAPMVVVISPESLIILVSISNVDWRGLHAWRRSVFDLWWTSHYEFDKSD
ncbi:hypothetical protein GCK72_025686 [Caenorhabditis remanei]|uniref:Uncharacterized protein n=1 Tax=Caenorhabditis remanei TaxID=31234 RepID=A0A6A5G3X4_CAERE|nr:hypothetical protein GCK72_025686 [Caenorhabditis remanei]KAF1749219.1 hypothetical protein GCK72_025686 [Caenorhabditis remanei]